MHLKESSKSRIHSIIRILSLGAWFTFLGIIALLALGLILSILSFTVYLLYTNTGWWCIPIILASILFITLATIGSLEVYK